MLQKYYSVYYNNGEEILDIDMFEDREDAVECIENMQRDNDAENKLYGWNNQLPTKNFSIVEEYFEVA